MHSFMKTDSIIIGFLGLLILGYGCVSRSSSIHEKSPNILVIVTDDQSKIDLGAYGNEEIKTPNMDKLATESMRFELAFTSTAMCVPSRSSLFTGLHPMRHGAHPNHAPIKSNVSSVARYMGDLGYKVGLIGKTHINPLSTFNFHYVKDLLDFDWDAKLTREEMRLAMKTLSKDETPFVLFVCISNPHVPWPGEWGGNPEEIQLPAHMYDNEKTRLAMSRYYAHVEVADQKVGEVIEVCNELNLYKDMVVFFTSDHGAELVHGKYTLYDAGINVPFMARWPGQIKPGTRSEAMIQFVDLVPTLIDIAGGKAVDSLDGRSFLPVLLEKTSSHHTHIFATSSKDGEKTDYPIKAVRTEQYKYILNPEYKETYTSWITDSSLGESWPGYDRHYGYWLTWLEEAGRDPRAAELCSKYLHRHMEELYDLGMDPDELNNIANDPSLHDIKLELRESLRQWMISQKDVHYSEGFFNELP